MIKSMGAKPAGSKARVQDLRSRIGYEACGRSVCACEGMCACEGCVLAKASVIARACVLARAYMLARAI